MLLTIISLLAIVLIACVIGAIAQAIVGYTRQGFTTSVAYGVLGAIMATAIAAAFDHPGYFAINVAGASFPIFWSIVGAAVVVTATTLYARRQGPWFGGGSGNPWR